jgi:hypothetical protein
VQARRAILGGVILLTQTQYLSHTLAEAPSRTHPQEGPAACADMRWYDNFPEEEKKEIYRYCHDEIPAWLNEYKAYLRSHNTLDPRATDQELYEKGRGELPAPPPPYMGPPLPSRPSRPSDGHGVQPERPFSIPPG